MTGAKVQRQIMLATPTPTFQLADIREIMEETYEWPAGSAFMVEQHADGSTTIIITQGEK